MFPASFPPAIPIIRRRLPSSGSFGSRSPASAVLCAAPTSRPPRASLRLLRFALPPPCVHDSLPLPLNAFGCGPGLFTGGPDPWSWRRVRDLPGSWGALCECAAPFDPGDAFRAWPLAQSVPPPLRRPRGPLAILSFRGCLTRPSRSLCTLRSAGRPVATQHSVPAGGQPLPGRFCSYGAPSKGFSLSGAYMTSPFPRLCLAHLPRKLARPSRLAPGPSRSPSGRRPPPRA
jgi:hypothetical protein